jgi:hypothetical protein
MASLLPVIGEIVSFLEGRAHCACRGVCVAAARETMTAPEKLLMWTRRALQWRETTRRVDLELGIIRSGMNAVMQRVIGCQTCGRIDGARLCLEGGRVMCQPCYAAEDLPRPLVVGRV